eukprot:3589594-Rhodomonas_salina.2
MSVTELPCAPTNETTLMLCSYLISGTERPYGSMSLLHAPMPSLVLSDPMALLRPATPCVVLSRPVVVPASASRTSPSA